MDLHSKLLPFNLPAEMYKILTAGLLVLLIPQALATPSPQYGTGTVDTECHSNAVSMKDLHCCGFTDLFKSCQTLETAC
ncbi:hypothetical protein BDZ94DRAFT_1320296 [Collybia nuda]|uniref:Uncharacterized protein n=1 Tax=Collybia nuda TaxID=64659 RepID=A0A9P5YAW8_9AGAR|nr:hypothetical protein BDZ94DRAFT_1320296 [Collybia nuda]